MINVVCGSTKNVTHPQKTLAMIRLIFADLAKTTKMTLLTMFGSSSPLQMIALQIIKLYPRKQSNSDLDTSSSTDNWKVFNKRGLHLKGNSGFSTCWAQMKQHKKCKRTSHH